MKENVLFALLMVALVAGLVLLLSACTDSASFPQEQPPLTGNWPDVDTLVYLPNCTRDCLVSSETVSADGNAGPVSATGGSQTDSNSPAGRAINATLTNREAETDGSAF